MKKSLLILTSFLCFGAFLQAQITKTMSVVPGGLFKALTYDERSNTTHLILTGSMDARDFKTIRDNMPKLEVLDISKVNIAAYEGTEGSEQTDKGRPVKAKYAEKTIPQYAFFKNGNGSGKRTIKNVIYPKNLIGVGERAFYACYNLSEVTIPASVVSLESEAYYNCKALASISVLSANPVPTMGKGVFYAVDPASCILHVKEGSKTAFQGAKQWNDFLTIEEDVKDAQ